MPRVRARSGADMAAGEQKAEVQPVPATTGEGPLAPRCTVPSRPRRPGSPTPSPWNRKAPLSRSRARRSIICAGAISTRPGLLLVHGNAAHAYWWSFIAPLLARDYNVAAMDLSGMGDSGWREILFDGAFRRGGACGLRGRRHVRARRAAGDRGPQLWRLRHHADRRAPWRTAGRHGDRRFARQSARPRASRPAPARHDPAQQGLSRAGSGAGPFPADAAADLRQSLSGGLGGPPFAQTGRGRRSPGSSIRPSGRTSPSATPPRGSGPPNAGSPSSAARIRC